MTFGQIDPASSVLIQGITGKEGSRMASWMVRSGARVCAGVTPGKGGQHVEGIPVFSSVREAREAFPALEISCVVVPGLRVRQAVEEACDAGICLIYVLSEGVPVHDVIALRRVMRTGGGMLLGPSSVGYLQFPAFRLGYLGGERPFEVLQEGSIAIVSGSGGMTNEILMACARAHLGVRVAYATGGDRVTGFSVEEAVQACASLSGVVRIGVFVEPGNAWLTELAQGMHVMEKPFVLMLAGEALDQLPRGLPYGHTGTLLGEDMVSIAVMREKLQKRGLNVVASVAELVEALRAR